MRIALRNGSMDQPGSLCFSYRDFYYQFDQLFPDGCIRGVRVHSRRLDESGRKIPLDERFLRRIFHTVRAGASDLAFDKDPSLRIRGVQYPGDSRGLFADIMGRLLAGMQFGSRASSLKRNPFDRKRCCETDPRLSSLHIY